MRRKKQKGQERIKSINGAILYGLDYLRKTHGLDIEADQLARYLETERVQEEIENYTSNPRFRKLAQKKQWQSLQEHIVKYVIERKPFNEKGKRLLEGSLEAIVGKSRQSWLRKILGIEKRGNSSEEYLSKKETAGALLEEIGKNPELMQLYPEMMETAKDVQMGRQYGAFADILYSNEEIGKDTYKKVKQRTADAYDAMINLAKKSLEKYLATPQATIIFGLLGISVIFADKKLMSGAVVGANAPLSVLSLIGIGLLCISASCLFWLKKTKAK